MPAPSLDYRLAALDAQIERARSTARTGLLGVLIAIVLTLIVFPLFPLWLLIGAAGLLAWGTNRGKVGQLEREKVDLMMRG